MKLCLIAAMSENRVIGAGNRLPWRLPADLKRFKQLTWGHVLIVGRKTYESIGRPLPGRRMIVVTRQIDYPAPPEVAVANSLEQALQLARSASKLFIGGGAEIYRQALPQVERMYLTRVQGQFEGDSFFPEVNWREWRKVDEEKHPADERHEAAFVFQVFDRQTTAGAPDGAT